jgi:hypothetical protein
MTVLQQYTVQRLRQFRDGLLAIDHGDLNYKSMEIHLVENRGDVDAVYGYNPIIRLLSPHQKTTDPTILEAVRQEVVRIVDDHILQADSQQIVRPILDDLVLKIKDTKLSTLLKEFNAAKETQPNLAAIGFRTIICLTIQERAKVVDVKSALANRQDLALQPMLDDAIATKIFPDGQTKLLQAYRRQGLKEHSDNIVHKPGSDMLVSKDDLSAAVDLLNKLLPTIV